MQTETTRQSGLGLTELFLGSAGLAIAVLGTVGGLMTSLKFAIDTKDENLAHQEARTYLDGFRKSAATDFDGAVLRYRDRTIQGTSGRSIQSRIILDETRFDPPIDLNGDGDCDDANLPLGEVNAAYIETSVTWGHDNSFSEVTLVRRPPAPANTNVTTAAIPAR
jgi:hypothetical protein